MTDASLISFRQAMVETPQLFAVAYLGCGTQEPSDPFRLMQETAPELCENLPFLLGIPKENVIGTSGELYSGCGNDQWFATVYQTSEDPIGHAVTLLADDTLLMQHSWEMDGMPMVSHGWYQRVTE